MATARSVGTASSSRRASDLSLGSDFYVKVQSNVVKDMRAKAGGMFTTANAHKPHSASNRDIRSKSTDEFLQEVVGDDLYVNIDARNGSKSVPCERLIENTPGGGSGFVSTAPSAFQSLALHRTPSRNRHSVGSLQSARSEGLSTRKRHIEGFPPTPHQGLVRPSTSPPQSTASHDSFTIHSSFGSASKEFPKRACSASVGKQSRDTFSESSSSLESTIARQASKHLQPLEGTGTPENEITVGYRGVSHLRACHGASRDLIPPTLIPASDHKVIREFQVAETDHGDWEFDPLAKNWVKTVFPSRLPAGRHEVSALDEWVDTALALLPTVNIHEISDRDVELLLRDDASAEMMGANILRTVDEIKHLEHVYCLAMHELTRQVYVHCEDRGNLMMKVFDGLKTCFENVEGIYSGKYRSYVHGLVTDLADTQRKLADKTEQLESQTIHFRDREEYYEGRLGTLQTLLTNEHNKDTMRMKKFLKRFQGAVTTLLSVTRRLGVEETNRVDDPQRNARLLSTEYLVQIENMSPEDAMHMFEEELKSTIEHITADQQHEMEEMAWTREFGFDDFKGPDTQTEQTLEDKGANAYAKLIETSKVMARKQSSRKVIEATQQTGGTTTAQQQQQQQQQQSEQQQPWQRRFSKQVSFSVYDDHDTVASKSQSSHSSNADDDSEEEELTPPESSEFAVPVVDAETKIQGLEEAAKFLTLGAYPKEKRNSSKGKVLRLFAGKKEFKVNFSNLQRRGERYSEMLARMCDPLVYPALSEPWRRGPDGSVVVFTPEAVIDAMLKFQATGLLQIYDEKLLKDLARAGEIYEMPGLTEEANHQLKGLTRKRGARNPSAKPKPKPALKPVNTAATPIATTTPTPLPTTTPQTAVVDAANSDSNSGNNDDNGEDFDSAMAGWSFNIRTAEIGCQTDCDGNDVDGVVEAVSKDLDSLTSASNVLEPAVVQRKPTRKASMGGGRRASVGGNKPSSKPKSRKSSIVVAQPFTPMSDATFNFDGVVSDDTDDDESKELGCRSAIIGGETLDSACGYDHLCPNCGARFRPTPADTREVCTGVDDCECEDHVSSVDTRSERLASGGNRRQSVSGHEWTGGDGDGGSGPKRTLSKVEEGLTGKTGAKRGPGGGSKKKDKWIPAGFQSLFQGVLPVITPQSSALPKRVALKMLQQIYRDKIVADAVDDAANNQRQTMPEYVYDWFLNKYGLRKLSEQMLTKMFATAVRFGKKVVDPDNTLISENRPINRALATEKGNEDCLYLFTFGRLIGLFDPLDRDEMDVYCDILGACLEKGDAKDEDGIVKLPLKTGINGVQGMLAEFLGGSSSVAWKAFVQKVEQGCLTQQTKRSNTKDWVDQEALMSTVLQEYGNLKERATQVLKALFLAADIDGDGNLTTEEFGDVVRLADATLSHQDVISMHAASVNDEGIMTADQFSVAATGHGLLSYKPSKAKGGAAGSTDKRTSSLIQALLMESAANAGQRFTVLQSAWNTHAPTVEKAVDHAKTHVLPAPDVSPMDKDVVDNAINVIDQQVTKMNRLLEAKTDPDAAAITYLLIMNKLKELKVRGPDGAVEDDGTGNSDNQYAQLLSTFGVEQRPAGWGKTVGVLKVAKRLLRKKEGGAGAQDTKPPTGFAALVSAMASKGGS